MKPFSQKISIMLAGLISVAGVCFILRNQYIIESLGVEYDELRATATAMKMSDPSVNDGESQIRTKYHQRDKTIRPTSPKTVKGFMDLALVIQQAKYAGKADDIESMKMNTEFLDGLMRLDSKQVKELLELLRKDDRIEYETREEIVAFAMKMLKERDFDACLEICLDSTELLKEYLVAGVIAEWARKDVNAALAWMRLHAASRPDIVNDDSKRSVIFAVSGSDISGAFKLINEFKMENEWVSAASIIMQAKTAERRSLALAELRKFIDQIEDPEDRMEVATQAYFQFASSLYPESFDEAVAWIDSASFSPAELELFANGFTHNTVVKNHSQWFDWMKVNLTPAKRDERIAKVISRWTEYDFPAAGTWLANAPDDPIIKPVAIAAYVEAVAPFEPGNAEDWALTLPPNDMRKELLKRIYSQWPQGNDTEKSAFAARHGLVSE